MKTILVDAINTFVIKDEGIFAEMYALLETYPNRKIILTGANEAQMKEFGLDMMPYEVFTLSHNPEKTDPRYYHMMLEHFHLAPSDCLSFEHNENAVKSSQSVGIQTFHYNMDTRDIPALKAFLDENLV